MTMHEAMPDARSGLSNPLVQDYVTCARLYLHTHASFMDPAAIYIHTCSGGCIHAGFYNHQRPTTFNPNPKNLIVAALCSSP